MFGLPSFGKLMVLAAVIGAVWFGFKMIGRMQQARDEQERQRTAEAKRSGPVENKGNSGDLELVQCPACGAYIPPGHKCNNCGGQV